MLSVYSVVLDEVEIATNATLTLLRIKSDYMRQGRLERALSDYRHLDDLQKLPQEDSHRIAEQTRLVSRFYDVVTAFYEWGWGASFHFSPRKPGESLSTSQLRHDQEIGELLELQPDMEVADIGCGVGGPLINIAQSTGARITGINFNSRQINRGEDRVRRAGLRETCSFLYADYMDVPLDDETFDAAYSFEAFCHAPNKRRAFNELHRLLKPGAEVAIVDWCLTDAFDSSESKHTDIRTRIERTNATPQLPTIREYVDMIRSAGFELIRAVDQQMESGNPSTPWFMALQRRDLSLSSLARIPLGRFLSALVTRTLEKVRLVPAGISDSVEMLNEAADALVEAGQQGIFTPSLLIHARKQTSTDV